MMISDRAKQQSKAFTGDPLTSANQFPFGRHSIVKSLWEGTVHVFDLTGHPTANRAYAWSSPIEGSDKRRFFAVLQVPPIKSARDAVKAAIVAEQREGP